MWVTLLDRVLIHTILKATHKTEKILRVTETQPYRLGFMEEAGVGAGRVQVRCMGG